MIDGIKNKTNYLDNTFSPIDPFSTKINISENLIKLFSMNITNMPVLMKEEKDKDQSYIVPYTGFYSIIYDGDTPLKVNTIVSALYGYTMFEEDNEGLIDLEDDEFEDY